MGYPLQLALRYLGSKKRASISVGTAFAILGVALGVAALATIMSVTGGFHEQFREKVLGVNAHVLVLKYSTNFREYRSVMEKVTKVDGVIGVAPFSINPMMLTHGEQTATGVLVKGVDPELSLGVEPAGDSEWGAEFDGLSPVLDLPKYVVAGSIDGLRQAGSKPAQGRSAASTATVATAAPMPPVPPGTATASASAASTAPPVPPPPASASAPSVPANPPAPSVDDLDAGVPDGAPVGLVEPDGGYASVLPDDDLLPPDVDPDLCADPEKVLQMPGIVVGVSLAKTLSLAHREHADGIIEWELGDCVTVTSPTIGFSFSSGQIKPPVAKRFRVVAVFEAGFDQYDSKLVYTDLYQAQEFYDHGDTVTGVEMKVDDIDRADEIADQISELLSSGLYHTMDWYELNRGLFTALTIQKYGMSLVLGLIIVVAAFTVAATLVMVVLDKTKEISVIKAMGATDWAVMRVFLYQAGIIGLVGTTVGLLLGWGVCEGLLVYGFPLDPKVYFISRLPVQVVFWEFAFTGVVALLICLLATIIPSLYAARLRPADGFRQQ